MLKVDHLYKSYQTGRTTLLNCISCFIPYDKGTISLKDVNLSKLDEKQIAKVRNEKLGFVFQDFMLLDGLTILENVCVPKVIRKEPCKQMESKAKKLLKMFGISEIAGKYPAEISGGQKQRTAVARALMNDPLLILADEPTGNLDSRSTVEIMNILKELHKNGRTVIVITHDDDIAAQARRVIRIMDGQVESDDINSDYTNKEREDTK